MRLVLVSLIYFACTSASAQEETHLKNLKKLTHGGDNAEAYFSFDGSHVSFQSNNAKWGLQCDQIFNLHI